MPPAVSAGQKSEYPRWARVCSNVDDTVLGLVVVGISLALLVGRRHFAKASE
jgi:hypothetical protein